MRIQWKSKFLRSRDPSSELRLRLRDAARESLLIQACQTLIVDSFLDLFTLSDNSIGYDNQSDTTGRRRVIRALRIFLRVALVLG